MGMIVLDLWLPFMNLTPETDLLVLLQRRQ